jgi:chromosome segregation ATPase
VGGDKMSNVTIDTHYMSRHTGMDGIVSLLEDYDSEVEKLEVELEDAEIRIRELEGIIEERDERIKELEGEK